MGMFASMLVGNIIFWCPESSYNVSDVEGQLLAVYEPVVIHDLLTDLYENRGLHPSQIIALNDRVSFWCSKHSAQKNVFICKMPEWVFTGKHCLSMLWNMIKSLRSMYTGRVLFACVHTAFMWVVKKSDGDLFCFLKWKVPKEFHQSLEYYWWMQSLSRGLCLCPQCVWICSFLSYGHWQNLTWTCFYAFEVESSQRDSSGSGVFAGCRVQAGLCLCPHCQGTPLHGPECKDYECFWLFF